MSWVETVVNVAVQVIKLIRPKPPPLKPFPRPKKDEEQK